MAVKDKIDIPPKATVKMPVPEFLAQREAFKICKGIQGINFIVWKNLNNMAEHLQDIICSKHPDILVEQRKDGYLAGYTSCSKCKVEKGNSTPTKQQFIELYGLKHIDYSLLQEKIYYKGRISVICTLHKNTYEQSVEGFYSSFNGCPFCKSEKQSRAKSENILNKQENTHYSLLPENYSIDKYYTFKCTKQNCKYEQVLSSHNSGMRGCPQCKQEKRLEINKSQELTSCKA